MRQRGVETLITEEPDDLIGHVRICGGAGWATAGSTRKRTRPRWRFLLNMKSSGWGRAAEGERSASTPSEHIECS